MTVEDTLNEQSKEEEPRVLTATLAHLETDQPVEVFNAHSNRIEAPEPYFVIHNFLYDGTPKNQQQLIHDLVQRLWGKAGLYWREQKTAKIVIDEWQLPSDLLEGVYLEGDLTWLRDSEILRALSRAALT